MARFEVGDTVWVNGLVKAEVLRRFYRCSTRKIMYEVKGRYGPHSVEEARLHKNQVGPDHWADARVRGRGSR
ncbi:MAG: hypothetical protein JNM62_00100 [Flavobacteriales bacterium]|nr:hypothetical protein [Flavobacteriales bacterium]